MSDILIKDMKMPKNCEECDFSSVGDISFDYELFCKCSKKYCDLDAFGHPIGWNCPLIEVNTPYGDLIDRNSLKRKAQKVATEAWKMNLTARVETTLNQFIDWINDAPTVIKGSSDVR